MKFCTNKGLYIRMEGWKDDWMDEWMNEWMDGYWIILLERHHVPVVKET